MTIRKKPKRRTTITHDMLDVLAKGIKRRRHKVAVARAMFGITVHEPDTGAPIARLNPVPGTDKFTVRCGRASAAAGCRRKRSATPS